MPAVPKDVVPYQLRLSMQAPRQTLRKTRRLSHRDQFSNTIKRGKRLRHPGFALFFLENGLAYARLGISVPHRVTRKATARNLLKRRARESFRKQKHRFGGLDMVLIPNNREQKEFFEKVSPPGSGIEKRER